MQHKYDFVGIVTDVELPRQVSEKLELCNIVVLEGDGRSKYNNYVQFEAAGFAVAKAQEVLKGDKVHICFTLNGREWQDKFFISLRVSSITVLERAGAAGKQSAEPEEEFEEAPKPAPFSDESPTTAYSEDDLPF